MIVLQNMVNSYPVTQLANRILNVMKLPILLNDQEVFISPSIGISSFPDCANTADELIQQADMAMYRAKNRGRNTFQFYSNELQEIANHQEKMKNDLHHAMQNQQLFLVYQPIYSADGKIYGWETLVRWKHPQQGLLLPTNFLNIAEKTGLIIPLGKWILQTALTQFCVIPSLMQNQDTCLSLNISIYQLRDSSFLHYMQSSLEKYHISPNRIILEINESTLVDDRFGCLQSLEELAASGIKIAIDDFGSGYASFRHLQKLPLHLLKLDHRFALEHANQQQFSLVESFFNIAQALSLPVIAQGIECKEHLEFFQQKNCPYTQGFYLSPPLTLEEIQSNQSSS